MSLERGIKAQQTLLSGTKSKVVEDVLEELVTLVPGEDERCTHNMCWTSMALVPVAGCQRCVLESTLTKHKEWPPLSTKHQTRLAQPAALLLVLVIAVV